MNSTKLDLTSLEKTLTSLKQLYQRVSDESFMSKQDNVVRLGLQAGLIQNLEFTYEVCWKMIKRWLKNNATSEEMDGMTLRQLEKRLSSSRDGVKPVLESLLERQLVVRLNTLVPSYVYRYRGVDIDIS